MSHSHIQQPWRILNFKVELQETKAPTGESPLHISEFQYPTEGMVIRTDDELLAFQVRPQLQNCPDDCQTLLLRGGVIHFRACQISTPVYDRTSISFRLVLEQIASDLKLGSIRVEVELAFRPRERQDGRMQQLLPQGVKREELLGVEGTQLRALSLPEQVIQRSSNLGESRDKPAVDFT
jgi:hypothetical protein